MKELLMVRKDGEFQFAVLTNDPDAMKKNLKKAEQTLKKVLGEDYMASDLAELMEEKGATVLAVFDEHYEML